MAEIDFDIAIGEVVSHSTICELAETQLFSAINHRHANQDEKYGVLFASEDHKEGIEEPYQFEPPELEGSGTFEFVGEGRVGNHSLESPGNRFLKNAINEPKPIFLFVKKTECNSKFIYYGKVEVHDYDFTTAKDANEDERKIVVFQMQLLQSSAISSLNTLVVLSASSL